MENLIKDRVDFNIVDEETDDLFEDIFDPMITGIGDMQNVSLSYFLGYDYER